MELAEMGELFDYLEIGGSLNEEISRYYFKNIIEALKYLHSNNISHCDIKPQNLLLTKDFKIKLADFGLASNLEEEQLSELKGTIR